MLRVGREEESSMLFGSGLVLLLLMDIHHSLPEWYQVHLELYRMGVILLRDLEPETSMYPTLCFCVLLSRYPPTKYFPLSLRKLGTVDP